jgi:hypothetical protein
MQHNTNTIIFIGLLPLNQFLRGQIVLSHVFSEVGGQMHPIGVGVDTTSRTGCAQEPGSQIGQPDTVRLQG